MTRLNLAQLVLFAIKKYQDDIKFALGRNLAALLDEVLGAAVASYVFLV